MGARDEVVSHVANDLNLPIEGQDAKPSGRRRNRFSHDRHLFHALLNLVYGHSFMEILYRFDEGTNRFHLRKLGPRMPGTISEISVERDGGLKYIRQYPSGLSSPRLGVGPALSLVCNHLRFQSTDWSPT
jgi:hypothetical protein